jgi:hypothetical protein
MTGVATASMGTLATTRILWRTINGAFDSSLRKRSRILLLFWCGLMAACSSNERGPPQAAASERLVKTSPLPGGRRTQTALYSTNQHTETTTVIRTELAWQALWQRVGPAPRPEIDFVREMLVVAGLALGGWDRDLSIRIDGSRSDSLVAIVHVRDGIPDLCILDGARAPMTIVRIARDPRPVVFRQEIEHLNCGRR